MGVYAGPEIENDGLVLYLDSINNNSYPGSGNTLYDLTSTNNVSVTGGLVYANNAVDMAGSTNYIDFSIPNFTTTVCTVEMIAKFKNMTNQMPFGWFRYDVFTSGGRLGYNTGAGDVYGLSNTQVTDLGLLNNTKHYAFVMRTDVSYTNNKIYVNGQSQTLSQITGTENTLNRTFNSGSGRIAGWKSDANYRMPMEMNIFKVYNRELTEEEVLNNFNALRGRFNL